MTRVVVMMDGGHVRACARRAGKTYDPDYIEKIAHLSIDSKEQALRVLYYDCPPFQGSVKLPVSRTVKQFTSSDYWLKELAAKDLFAVRLGKLKIRGFERKDQTSVVTNLTDDDFRPVFEQKGVDMRIGLDIASYSTGRLADRIILMTGDADCIPAMKHARKAGLQVVLVEFPNARPVPALKQHADYVRKVPWP
jgi:uncharacterized LabA/DUF88 family protein